MNEIILPYGKKYQKASIHDAIDIQVIDPVSDKKREPSATLLKESLDNPIGSDRVENLVTPSDNVVIVINDHTRPGPTQLIVEQLIGRLCNKGISDSQIRFLVATGSHRRRTIPELDEIIGAAFRKRFRIHIHDCQNDEELVYLGEWGQGLPVYINRLVIESDVVITTGLIAPHHSAGYSGGRKSILPGVAGLKTLQIHHSLPIRPFEPAMGFIYSNPFHEVSLEVAKKIDVRFMINSVQNPHKDNIAFVCGELEKAHALGVEICKNACEVEINKLADVVITSPGGYPRDINLYQAQKALSVAEPLGCKNCVYILLVEGADGIGEGVFKQWMVEANTPGEVIERFKDEGYNVGSNKAFMYSRALTKGRVIVVSDHLAKEELNQMMLEWAPDLQTAIDMASANKSIQRIIALPRAVNIVPIVNIS